MTEPYAGQNRRAEPEYVHRDDFTKFTEKSEGWRNCIDRKITAIHERLERQDQVLARIDTAMFAKDGDNEHGTPGVMTVMQKVDRHIDVMCGWAHAFRRIVVGALGLLIAVASAVTAGKTIGLW